MKVDFGSSVFMGTLLVLIKGNHRTMQNLEDAEMQQIL